MKSLSKVLLICLLLSGCASQQLPPANVEIPANLVQHCEPLQELAGMTGKDLLENITVNAAIYHRCSDSHNALIEAVRPKNK